MDSFLRKNLLTCLAAYMSAVGARETTIGQKAAGDWRFFRRVANPSVTFTIRKYEEVMLWFRVNWPANTDWPKNVPHRNSWVYFFSAQTGTECVEPHLIEVDRFYETDSIQPRSVQA